MSIIIEPMKHSQHVQTVLDLYHKWRILEQNNNLHIKTLPCTADEFLSTMDTPFTHYDGGPELIKQHYVGLRDGEVVGYFHYDYHVAYIDDFLFYSGNHELINTMGEFYVHGATAAHCYNFSTPYKFGKLQSMFYDYITDKYDFVEVLTPDESAWANGEFDAFGNALSCPEINARRKETTGFALPHLLLRAHKKYNAVLTPYCLNLPLLDGTPQFHHWIRWRGTHALHLPQFSNTLIRPDSLREQLYNAGITEYL